MPLPVTFAGLSTSTMANLDTNFSALGALTTIPCLASGTNTISLTPLGNTPLVTAYAEYLIVSFLASATNTGAATAAVSGLAALPIVKDGPIGPAALTGGEIVTGNYVTLAYDPNISSWHLRGFSFPTIVGAPPGTITSNVGTPISAAALTGNGTTQAVLLRAGTAAGDYNDTTDTATALVAAIPGCRANTYFHIRMINNTNHVQTLLAGSGVTVSGTATTTNGTTHDFVGVVTAVGTPTVTIYG